MLVTKYSSKCLAVPWKPLKPTATDGRVLPRQAPLTFSSEMYILVLLLLFALTKLRRATPPAPFVVDP